MANAKVQVRRADEDPAQGDGIASRWVVVPAARCVAVAGGAASRQQTRRCHSRRDRA